jgi:hypothetical protein
MPNNAQAIVPVADEEATLSHKIAQLLDERARQHPYRFISFPEATKKVFKLPRMPSDDSADVRVLKRRMQRARIILDAEYGRGYIYARGQGIRASVDEQDRARNCIHKTASRAQAAITRHVAETGSIDASKIRERALREYTIGQQQVAKQLGSQVESLKQLPPPKREESEVPERKAGRRQ